MTEPTSAPAPSSGGETGNWIVLALLVMICVALGGLWFLEHSQRRRAEDNARQVQKDFQARQRGLAEMGLLAGPSEVDWTAQTRKSVTLDGESKQAILITTGLGGYLGLAPGDVVIVSPDLPPATMPADARPIQTP